MTHPVPPEILALINGLSTTSGRRLIAVAGPPASGKSTLAEQLADILPDARYSVLKDQGTVTERLSAYLGSVQGPVLALDGGRPA